MDKIRVLFVAAAPSSFERVDADQEFWFVADSLREARHRDRFDLVFRPAAKRSNFLREMLQCHPHIVHFSGHGNDRDELIFEGESREPDPVSPQDLERTFNLVSSQDRAKVVILSACFSENQARAVSNVVDCTIGMSQVIRDSAAFAFSRGFYNALGEGRSVDQAVNAGRVNMAHGSSELPKLYLREGSPVQLQLIDDGPIDEFPSHVDRTGQLECFGRMLGGGEPRMLVLTAEGTMGKSRLMRRMAQEAVEAEHPIALPDLTTNTKTPHEVLEHLARDLEVPLLTASAVASAPPRASLEFIQAAQPDVASYHQADPRLASGYHSDLEQLTRDFVGQVDQVAVERKRRAAILLDGFDNASGHVAVWIEDVLLPAIAKSAQIVCVVAGRAEPNIRPTIARVRRERLLNFEQRDVREMLRLLRLDSSDSTAYTIWLLSEKGQPYATVCALEKMWREAKGALR